MRKTVLITILSVFCFLAMAQEKQDSSYWKNGGITSLNFSQTSLTNWSGGGDDAISGNVLLNLFANYNKKRISWENVLNMEYGLIKQGGQGVRKSIDKIHFTAKMGLQGRGYWFYSALIDFRTQFAKGYNYPNKEDVVSEFLAPAYITISLGNDYKPSEIFSAYLSYLTGKITIVNNDELSDAGGYGVDPGDKVRGEFGAFTKFTFKKDVMENVNLQSVLDLFSGYTKEFGNIDVNWEVLIAMRVNDFITANISTALIYDDDVDYIDEEGFNKGPKIQFKEIVGVGITYRF